MLKKFQTIQTGGGVGRRISEAGRGPNASTRPGGREGSGYRILPSGLGQRGAALPALLRSALHAMSARTSAGSQLCRHDCDQSHVVHDASGSGCWGGGVRICTLEHSTLRG